MPLGKAEVVKFSNENIFPKINQNVREHDVFIVQPMYPNVSDSILELLIMIDKGAISGSMAKEETDAPWRPLLAAVQFIPPSGLLEIPPPVPA